MKELFVSLPASQIHEFLLVLSKPQSLAMTSEAYHPLSRFSIRFGNKARLSVHFRNPISANAVRSRQRSGGGVEAA
jgi:hypothetical protein